MREGAPPSIGGNATLQAREGWTEQVHRPEKDTIIKTTKNKTQRGNCIVAFGTKALIVCSFIVKQNCLLQIIDLAIIVHHKRKPHNHCSHYP